MANPQKQFNKALQLHQAGQVAEAVELYTSILPRLKDNPQLLFLLGTAYLQLGQLASCIDLMQRALRLEPGNAYACINLGNASQSLGRLEEAVAAYDRALALKPDLAEVHNNRGAALLGLGRMDEALASCEQALALRPDYAEAHNNRGHALKALGRTHEALAAFERALALRLDYAEAHNNRAVVLVDLGRAEEALASYDQALALALGYAEAHCNRGHVLVDLDRAEEALASYDRALALNPAAAKAHFARGNALLKLRRVEQALASFDQALALAPDDAEAHNNRGGALLQANRPHEALASYDRALALNPDDAATRVNKAVLLLLMGAYPEGWELYEWRLKQDADGYDRFPQPSWRGGEDIRGKRLLVQGEQGFGDVIQFCRYLPRLRELGAEVIFEAPRPLLSLIATLDCPMTLVAKGGPLPEFDAHCPLMSLPHAFGTALETIPADVPYLYADADKVAQWRQQLGKGDRPRIGVVWSGAVSHKNPHRSMQLSAFLPLTELPVDFHSLQVEYREHDLELLARHPEIRQHQHALRDFSDTTALIACMDLVITVDTGVAHVAGAMGKPVWILLSHAADYRWLLDRHDSPWYPTARLFRQPALDDWPGVIAEVGSAMQALASA